MAENGVENEEIKTKKETFLANLKNRYPDLPEDDEDAIYGKLGEEFDKFDKSDKAQKELGDLLASDPRSAEFLMMMRKGGNPVEFLIEKYGDDFKAALESEEGKEKFAGAFSKYVEKQTKDKELQKQAEDNLQTMIDDLDKAQEEGNFSDEDARKAYEYLYGDGGLLDRIIINGVNKEDWMTLMKAASYDKSMAEASRREAEAREEGEIAGRNANIDIKKKKQTKAESVPANLGSGGGRTPVGKKTDPTLDRINQLTGKKSVWDD